MWNSGTMSNGVTEQWNSGVEVKLWNSVVEQWNRVEQFGGTVGRVWWNSGVVWNCVVEQ